MPRHPIFVISPFVSRLLGSALAAAASPGTAIITARYSFDTTNSAAATVHVTGPIIP